jgi:2'-5' RNA ligase
MSSAIRCFLAFELPPGVKETAVRVLEDMRTASGEVNWVKRGGMHLTVVFLGNMAPDRLSDISDTAGDICRRFAPFDAALEGTGFFPPRGRPRVVWLGIRADTKRMGAFRDALQDALSPLGVKKETRPFKPHLTLGRFRKDGRLARPLDSALSRYRDLQGPEFTLRELVLFRSELKPGGAVYTELDRFPLAEDARGTTQEE